MPQPEMLSKVLDNFQFLDCLRRHPRLQATPQIVVISKVCDHGSTLSESDGHQFMGTLSSKTIENMAGLMSTAVGVFFRKHLMLMLKKTLQYYILR